MNRMKIPAFKKKFSPEILKRGYDYYKEGRVTNLIIDGNTSSAIVVGNRRYRVKLNLKTGDYRCTCPCEFNCKHMVAVLYALKENKNVETTDNLKEQLNQKSKDELIAILQKILVSEPRFKLLLGSEAKDVKKIISSLSVDLDQDVDELIDEVDRLFEAILARNDKLTLLVILFKKSFSLWDEVGGIEPLESSMFDILEAISIEAKKLKKDERQQLLQELVDLTKDFEFFWDSIDDRGLRLRYQ